MQRMAHKLNKMLPLCSEEFYFQHIYDIIRFMRHPIGIHFKLMFNRFRNFLRIFSQPNRLRARIVFAKTVIKYNGQC